MMRKRAFKRIVPFIWIVFVGLFVAAVQEGVAGREEADRLNKDLTPFGSIRAGNAEGTIPEWTGGLVGIPEGIMFDPKSGLPHPDPFEADEVLFTITAQNMDSYSSKLSEGQKALFRKYPDTYRMNVYQTRRTAAAPQWVYDNIHKNALNAVVSEDGQAVSNVYGGIPFPIPHRGEHIMKNHQARWEGGDTFERTRTEIVLPNGSRFTGGGSTNRYRRAFYHENKSDEFEGWTAELFMVYELPTRRNGELFLGLESLNYSAEEGLTTWQYLPGQRRVRRSPTVGYDTPNPSMGGLAFYDEAFGFVGPMNRFDWRIVEKREMFIPYNNYQVDLAELDDLLTPFHPNPEHLRWELHRVWVVEATLRDGSRHAYGRRIFYLNEDTWIIALSDNFDTRGNLWTTRQITSRNFYDIPALRLRALFYFDLQQNQYAAGQILFDGPRGTIIYEPQDKGYFNPQGLRREGRR